MLKKLLAKLQEETKPPCEKTAKKELEEVRESVIKGAIYTYIFFNRMLGVYLIV